MKLTPIDVAHKTFGKKLIGISEEEVTEFLRLVAVQMEETIRDRNDLKESLREKELTLLEVKEHDEMLRTTIATAAQMAEKLRQDAEREARLIINEANQKAEAIVKEARESLKKNYQEISELRRIRMQFEANLKSLAQAHLTLLEQGERYMPQMSLSNMSMVPGAEEKSVDVSPLSAT